MITRILLSMTLVTMANGQGYTDDLDNTWSYQWYPDECFRMICNNSKLAVMDTDYVVWETPGKTLIDNDSYSDTNYVVSDLNGVPRVDLLIKRLYAQTNGVYICRVYNSYNDSLRAQTILAVNMKGHKYHKLFDKYRHNLIVAVIATAVFAVPLMVTCFTFHFRYRDGGHDGEEYPNDIAHNARSVEGKGAYENSGMSMSKM